MTSYFPDFEAIEREKLQKEELGYFDLLEAASKIPLPNDLFRSETIVEECVAAGLAWDSEGMIVSTRDRGVTDQGNAFLELSENFCGGPWRRFYVKPNMLQPLISYLDNNSSAAEIVHKHYETRRRILDRQKANNQRRRQEQLRKEKTKQDSVLSQKVAAEAAQRDLGPTTSPKAESNVVASNARDGKDGPSGGQVAAYWAVLPAIFLLGMAAEKFGDPDMAIKIIGGGGLLWFLWPIWMSIGENTARRAGNTVRIVIFICVFAFVAAILGAILPSSCTQSSGGDPTEMYYRR